MFKVPVLKSETASGIPINLPLRPAVSGEDGRAMPKLGRDRRNDEGDGCCPLGSCDSNSTDTDADAAASPLVFFWHVFQLVPMPFSCRFYGMTERSHVHSETSSENQKFIYLLGKLCSCSSEKQDQDCCS